MSNYDKSETRKEIQKILVEEKPKTVRELVKKTVVTTGKEKEEIYQIVKKLEKERIIKLGSQKVVSEEL